MAGSGSDSDFEISSAAAQPTSSRLPTSSSNQQAPHTSFPNKQRPTLAGSWASESSPRTHTGAGPSGTHGGRLEPRASGSAGTTKDRAGSGKHAPPTQTLPNGKGKARETTTIELLDSTDGSDGDDERLPSPKSVVSCFFILQLIKSFSS